MSRLISGGKQVVKSIITSNRGRVPVYYLFSQNDSHAKCTVRVSTILRHYNLLSGHLRSLLHLGE